MKKLMTIMLLSVFLIATIGIEVRVHYCGGVPMQVAVNGVHIHDAMSGDMPACEDGDGCPSCKNVHQTYKVQTPYGMGQTVLLQPSVSHADWFHGGMPAAGLAASSPVLFPPMVVKPSDIVYQPRSHPGVALPPGGLRAPPVA